MPCACLRAHDESENFYADARKIYVGKFNIKYEINESLILGKKRFKTHS